MINNNKVSGFAKEDIKLTIRLNLLIFKFNNGKNIVLLTYFTLVSSPTVTRPRTHIDEGQVMLKISNQYILHIDFVGQILLY